MWFARFDWSDSAARDVVAAQAIPLRVYREEAADAGCAYFHSPPPEAPGLASIALMPLLDLAGAAQGQAVPWHYIVATDVAAGHEADFNAWYDQEHLPGLVAVPGVVRAARYRVSSTVLQVGLATPAYHAAYDFAEKAAFNSPPWLAIRGTPWSGRVRPHFRNTLRTMYVQVG